MLPERRPDDHRVGIEPDCCSMTYPDEEIAVGRVESDGDGRVRPSPRFPAGIVEALADLGEPR
jgi:hypothetical protein